MPAQSSPRWKPGSIPITWIPFSNGMTDSVRHLDTVFQRGDSKACGETYLHSLFLAVVGGFVIAGVGVIYADQLYRVMGADRAVAILGAGYFRLYILSAPLTLVGYCSIGFYRGIQNSRLPMLIAFMTTGMQLTLDYTLIYGRFDQPPMGLVGAAAAACCSQFAGAIVYLAHFFIPPKPLTTERSLGASAAPACGRFSASVKISPSAPAHCASR